MWIALAILSIIGIIGIYTWKSFHSAALERMRVTGKSKGYSDEDVEKIIAVEQFPLPSFVQTGLITLTVIFVFLGTFNKVFFYAEPGYIYHVRTITGEERVIDSIGYSYYFFGRYNTWKKAMTVQAVKFVDNDGDGLPDLVTDEGENSVNTSASLPPLTVIMLDQVDSRISATTRFRIPSEPEQFLKMAREYRTPENLLRTALIPAFKETLQATGSLMAVEEYFSGRRTEFNAEFEKQMQDGIYLVSRQQKRVIDPSVAQFSSAMANKDKQNKYGEVQKVVWEVKKKLDANGQPVRKSQKFTDYGIVVIEARVTDLVPNSKFAERMQLKQQASADKSIAVEKRVQEQEQKLLAIATGEREVAQEQAKAKRVQIKATTEAETAKQLVLIQASQQLEQANIDKQTAQVTKEKADIDAVRIKVLADADKYERQAKIAGDNALQQKLDTELAVQTVWADAYAKRAVPQYVFGGGGEGAPVGSDLEVTRFLQLQTINAAKSLNYDRGIPAIK